MDQRVTSVQWNFLPLTLSYETCLTLGTPRDSPYFIRDISYCPVKQHTLQEATLQPIGAVLWPQGTGLQSLQHTQLQAEHTHWYPVYPANLHMLQKGFSQPAKEKISKWVNTVNIVNTGVFMLWVQLKEHRLSFKVLPLEIGDRRSPNQNISDIAWYRTDTGGNMRRVWLKEFRKSEWKMLETITDIVRWVLHWNFHVW